MKAHKRSELTPKQRPKVKYFLKVGKIKFIKMFKFKSKMIIAVILIIGITAFVGCEKDSAIVENTSNHRFSYHHITLNKLFLAYGVNIMYSV